MNSAISFQELAKQNRKILSRQLPVTLQQAKQQVKKLKSQSSSSKKKQSSSQNT